MKSTFARKTPFKKKNTNIFAFRHAGCPLPCRLEPNFERLWLHEYATKFGKNLDLKSGDMWKSKIEWSGWFSKNNVTLVFMEMESKLDPSNMCLILWMAWSSWCMLTIPDRLIWVTQLNIQLKVKNNFAQSLNFKGFF